MKIEMRKKLHVHIFLTSETALSFMSTNYTSLKNATTNYVDIIQETEKFTTSNYVDITEDVYLF